MSNKIKVAIDLTPLRPGGENGGAKTLVTTLLTLFKAIQNQEFQYLLICEDWNQEELLRFSGANVNCILRSEIYDSSRSLPLDNLEDRKSEANLASQISTVSNLWKRFTSQLKPRFKRLLKPIFSPIRSFLGKRKQRFTKVKNYLRKQAGSTKFSKEISHLTRITKRSHSRLSSTYDIDLLFCPFSSPHLAEEGLPVVAIFYDLQHLDLPGFFTGEERDHRDRFLQDLVCQANRIICISNFSKYSLSKHFHPTEGQLVAIPICIHERLVPPSDRLQAKTLAELNLEDNQYIFFPANFWPHKNHRMLLAAYSIYRQQHPTTAVDLVFTGALDQPQRELQEIVTYLGCADHVHFLGFLREETVTCLWQGCRGLIFPSLYEGFGIPVLEAMWFDKPVACSNFGSLPEVGGDAVIYFDPRQPEAIARAIGQLAHDPQLTTRLRERARQHLQKFSQQRMAEQYLKVFREVVTANPPSVSTP
jgi:glycosyltransferase involved in cell wall biosynthesis